MHCNGKCYLYRQLKKAADEEAATNRIPATILKLKTIDRFIVATSSWQWRYEMLPTKKDRNIVSETVVLEGYANALFRPPQAIV